jgi:hypothetical protein
MEGVPMIGLVLLSSIFLTAQAEHPAPSASAPKPTQKASIAENPDQALAEYNARREKTPSSAPAQWKLALWCEERGLKAEAYLHFSEVVRLDPKRDAAWKKLGFKKVGSRWSTDAQIAEENEQKKADKNWAPRLRKLHKDIHGTNGAEKARIAQEGLNGISDPRAVLPLYREFGGGGELDQVILIQLLGQIDKPVSSKVLAMLAVFGQTSEVRRRATETLRGRPAEDFLDLLVGVMTDTLKYEVRPVGGPGSPGVIFVEGERFNVNRYYAPPAAPEIGLLPGDFVSFDPSGVPIINRPVGQDLPITSTQGVRGSKTLVSQTQTNTTRYAQISLAELALEAQRGAFMAQFQLEGDVAAIKTVNEERRAFNERVMAIAKDATGKDHGNTPKQWRDALAHRTNSSKQPDRTRLKPTVDENVPLLYNPEFMPVGITSHTVTQTRVYVDT